MRIILIYIILMGTSLSILEAGEQKYRDDVSEFIEKANNLAQEGNYKEAYIEINHALKSNPKSARLYRFRGNLNFLRKHFEASVDDFTKVIKAFPKNSQAYSDRAMVYYAMENYEQAAADAAQALSLNPGNKMAEQILLEITADKDSKK